MCLSAWHRGKQPSTSLNVKTAPSLPVYIREITSKVIPIEATSPSHLHTSPSLLKPRPQFPSNLHLWPKRWVFLPPDFPSFSIFRLMPTDVRGFLNTLRLVGWKRGPLVPILCIPLSRMSSDKLKEARLSRSSALPVGPRAPQWRVSSLSTQTGAYLVDLENLVLFLMSVVDR